MPIINDRIPSIIQSFEKQDYAKVIRQLHELGHAVHAHYHIKNSHGHEKTCKECLDTTITQRTVEISDDGLLAFCVFEEAWIDDYLRSPIQIDEVYTYRRHLSAKFHFNRAARHNINLGMRALALSIKQRKPLSDVNNDEISRLDNQASLAIKNYQPRKERILTIIGKVFAFITSLILSTTVAGATAALLSFTPFAFTGITTALVFLVTTIIYWYGTKNLFPRILRDLCGKDKWLEGWLYYRDDETGKKEKLSRNRKIALALSMGLATILSLTTGIMAYSFIANMGQIALFSFLAAGTVGASLLPPVGIAIAIVFSISAFAYLVPPLLNMIRSKNIYKLLARPFRDAAFIFDADNVANQHRTSLQLRVQKGLAYCFLGVLSIITILGFVALRIQYAQSLAIWMNTALAISAATAIAIADTIFAITTFIGQLPYLLTTLTRIMLLMVSGLKRLHGEQNFAIQSSRIASHPTPAPRPVAILFSPNQAILNSAASERAMKVYDHADHLPHETSHKAPDKAPRKAHRERHYHSFLFQPAVNTVEKCSLKGALRSG
ncbi:MAG: hypothetical protein ACD_60C00165G0002 [uncultured bacterium]|nr:MAG: hypothetical protein ACD_60C00165G0002 [uncultured bacterium]